MLLKSSVFPPAVFLAALFGFACDESGPAAPSPVASAIEHETPTPVADLSALAGVWPVTVRLVAVAGDGCVADMMRSQIGVPAAYSLTISRNGNLALTNASDHYSCGYAPRFDRNGAFTTYEVPRYFDCTPSLRREFTCPDGTLHPLVAMASDVTGQVSATAIKGTWGVAWVNEATGTAVEMSTEFSGKK